MTVSELMALTEDAEAHVAALQAEQASLQRRVGQAVMAGDVATVAKLRPRLAELPDAILQARVAHQRARLSLVEAERVADKERCEELRTEIGPVIAQIKALEAMIKPSRGELALIQMRLDSGRHRPMMERQRLEKLLVEQAETMAYDAAAAGAPVVRSAWQANTARIAH